MLGLALPLPGCAAHQPARPLAIATITSAFTFGGQARFAGRLIERDGCLVATDGVNVATPIFDPGATLGADRKTISDTRAGVEVPIGRPFRAGVAWLRDHGRGWSVAAIETFYGTRLPPGCPTDTVIRLHSFTVTSEGRREWAPRLTFGRSRLSNLRRTRTEATHA